MTIADHPDNYDVVVIGAGVVGAATAREAARRGHSVLVVEQGDSVHAAGSSRGDVRVWHFAGYPSDDYLQRGVAALEGWRDLERESARSLLLDTGGGLSGGAGIEEHAALLARAGRTAELLARRDVERRWPGITWWCEGPVLYQEDSGVILASAALQELLASARRWGAVVKDRTAVLRLECGDEKAVVAAEHGPISARRVIVTAGPWARSLLATADIVLDVAVTEQTVVWYPWRGPAPPVVIDYDEPGHYSLYEPGRGLKSALHSPGRPIADPVTSHGVPQWSAVERVSAWVGERFDRVAAAPSVIETCRYTWTPDEAFLLERHGPIVIGSACSGRGFQYAPDTAQKLVDLALES